MNHKWKLDVVLFKNSCIDISKYILSYMCIIFVLHNWLYVMYHLPPKMETSLLQTQPPLANCNSLKVRFKIYLYVSSKQKGRLVQVSCSLCSETMERDILDIHKGENCPQRIVTCQFCEFPLPAIDLAEHQVVFIKNFWIEKISYTFALISVWYLYLSGSMRESNRALSPL